MKAIIMAGGFGTRLRPLTINIPKPMVPIGNLPMMEHVVALLKQHGFDEIIALVFYQSEKIKEYFGDGSRFGVTLDYVLPDEDLGTAGAVRSAVDFCDETVLVISGDVLTDFDLGSALQYHKKQKGDVTILLTRMENPLPYGIVLTDKEDKITRFMEKPSWGEAFSDTINTGIYFLEPTTVRLIPPKTNFDFSNDLFPVMLKQNKNLLGTIAQGYWRDVGNIDEYFKAGVDLIGGKFRLPESYQKKMVGNATVFCREDTIIPAEANLSGTVIIGERGFIGKGARIENSIIGDRVEIGAEAVISGSIIWSDTVIGDLSTACDAIITSRVRIGREVSILDRAVVADECQIGAGARIRANCKIWPGKIVDDGAIVSSSIVWGEKWNRELFTDSKVSGLGLTEITPELAVKLGAAFGASLGRKQRIVTSRDASDVSRLLKRSIMCGLMATGVDVDDLEILPAPILRHALKNGNYGAGIYIRHSTINYNTVDIIFFDANGLDLPTSKSKKVERSFNNEDFPRASMAETGHLEQTERLFDNYRSEFLSSTDCVRVREANFKMVIDYSYGAAGQFFHGITSELGIDALGLNAFADPLRASEHSKLMPEKVRQLSTIVNSLSADMGVIINPAAEKMTVIDEQGIIIDPQLLLLMVTELYLNYHKTKRIAVPVSASMGVEDIAAKYNVEVMRVRNDHLSMMDAHLRGGADFVGGTLGGFIFPRFQVGADAMYAIAHLLEMMAGKDIKLSDLRQRYATYIRKSVSVPCPWGKKGQVMRNLIVSTENKNRQLIDGVRVFEDNGWVLVAPDRLTASFGIMAEAKSEADVDSIINQYIGLVEESRN